MKATDLRIGNLIQGIHLRMITDVDLFMFGEMNDDDTLLDHYVPIPLTEEWLIKFGFEKRVTEYDYDYILTVKGIGGFVLVYCDDFSITIFNNENDLGITPNIELFKHVHSLQNLYFALTNEELTIKL